MGHGGLKFMKTLITIIFFFILITAPVNFAQTGNRPVAFVNDGIITLYELNNRIKEETGNTPEELRLANEEEYFNTRNQVLDLIIDEKLIESKVKEFGIDATQSEIDESIEAFKERRKITQEELIEQLTSQGKTLEYFKDMIKSRIEQEKLISYEIQQKIIVTEEKLHEYYDENKRDYEKPGKVHIAGIFLTGEGQGSADINELRKQGKEILERLKKGEKFEDLAREYSKGPGAEDGGDLGDIETAQIDSQLREVIKGLENGDVSQLINRGSSIQIIKLIKRTEIGFIPFEEVKDEIFENIYRTKIKERFNEWVKGLRDDSFIEKKL